MTLSCIIRFESTSVELSVASDSTSEWLWSIRLLNGNTLERGTSLSQTAAQIVAQRVLEARLKRAELGRWVPQTYRWTQHS